MPRRRASPLPTHEHPPHDHDHHHHVHAPASYGRAFAIGIALNVAYVLAEAGYGVGAHSLALLADAGHNLGDVLGLFGAWLAVHLGTRRPSRRFTYGLGGASILAALGNAVLLLLVTGGIAWEAIRRLAEPEPVASAVIMVVSAAGIAVNGVTALLFLSGRKTDLNLRGAFLHMAADAAVSAGVVLAGGLILLTGWERVDPAASLLVSAVIVLGTWSLLRDAVSLALGAVPEGVDQDAIARYLAGLPGVAEVHDLHIWPLSTTETALTAHLVLDDATDGASLLHRLSGAMKERFGIGHPTFQIETTADAASCRLRPADVV
ncbi:MAG: cation transporter [Rhodospirillales bacterium]|nr:cation transporter [Rhodospirillales bacterium]